MTQPSGDQKKLSNQVQFDGKIEIMDTNMNE